MIEIGRYKLFSVVTGRYRLDGGAMFGVVPKVLWKGKTQADHLNRIALTMRTLVAIDRDASCWSWWTPAQATSGLPRRPGVSPWKSIPLP